MDLSQFVESLIFRATFIKVETFDYQINFTGHLVNRFELYLIGFEL